MKCVFIVAGDHSGDIIASQLITSMKKLRSDLFVVGVGGEHIKSVSDRFLVNIVQENAVGLTIALKKFSYFKHVLNEIIKPELEKNPPDVVIPVDFYGFNGRVAELAKSLGRPVYYYVSPQFWASRPWRAERLRKVVDLFLCLFPFELDFYKKRSLPAHFVGHPILDKIPEINETQVKPQRVEAMIGLLPGSRAGEIKRHLPIMAEACEIIKKKHPGTRFILFTVPNIDRDLYKSILTPRKSSLLIELVQDVGYSWRSQIDMAMTASGLETLENTLLGVPMVVMYKTDWLTYAVAKMVITIPYLGMPNLLAGKEIAPEFIQWRATPKNLAAPLLQWLKNPPAWKNAQRDLLSLRKAMGGSGASDRAAKLILEKVA